ncbi:MAG: hypothetical protein AAF560_23460 [Acidobacteriota bacterium]
MSSNTENNGLEHDVFSPARSIDRDIPRPGIKKVALFVLHGMGQQVKFETLDKVVHGLVAAAPSKDEPYEIRIGTVELDPSGLKVQRAEVDLETSSGQAFEAHIYEGHWAHFTEGLVNGRDVLGFLFSGARNGLMGQTRFSRWMFGRRVSFDVLPTSFWGLLLAFSIALGIVLINALISVMASSYLIGTLTQNVTAWPTDSMVKGFTITMLILIVYSLAMGAYLYVLARLGLKRVMPRLWELAAKTAHRVLLPLWCLMVVGLAAFLAFIPIWGRFWPDSLDEFAIISTWPSANKLLDQEWFVLAMWIVLLWVSYLLRNLVVETIGDVAAYLSSHKLDRFKKIRDRIQDEMLEVARAIYANGGDQPTYDRVAILGHSLGSVVAYDTLNKLISDDEIACRELQVLERTKVLLTFGSPLDKTAYIFRFHSQHTTDTREALATAVQPLIQDYEHFRGGLHWINVYSWRDIISGDLDYYDDRDNSSFGAMAVDNVEDKDSQTPLIAHVEYWNNPTVFRELYRSLFRPDRVAEPSDTPNASATG